MKRQWMIRVMCIVCLALPAWASQPAVTVLPDGSVEVMCRYETPQVLQSELYLEGHNGKPLSVHAVVLPGYRAAALPGQPVLPIDNVIVAIPQFHRVVDVQVTAGMMRTVATGLVVEPAQPETPLSMAGPFRPVPPDPAIYLTDTEFPGTLVDAVKPLYCRGYRMVSFNLRPVQYHPSTGTVTVAESLTARVITEPEPARPADIVRCRGLEVDREWAKRKVSNPGMIDQYSRETPLSGSPLTGSRDNYPYVIVTSDEFQGSFAPFLAHKQAHGYPGTIVTVSWITSNYSGQDNAEKVRNFVIDAYTNWNLEFLLLGGDDDKADVGGESGDFIVPSRDFYSTTAYFEDDNEIPADMYFACLDGTFNHDGDALWAEPSDGPSGGEVDWFGEVHVGRACVDSTAEILGFTDFVMVYENSNPDEGWMTQAYMIGELLWSDPTYGGDYKDEIKFGASSHGYTTAGFPPEWTVGTLYDRDVGTWGESQLYAILNSNNVHVINHLGHSDVDYCMRIYNSDVDNDLTNTIPWFGYSQGCYDGSFDDRGTYSTTSTDCICEHMTTQTQGPFAFIGNSRYGWGEHSSTNGSSQYYDRQFFDAIFGEEIVELGAANQDSKEDNIGFLDYGANRWCAYELNLFGCPQTCLGGGISSAGILSLDRQTYGDGVPMTVTVRDLDLNQNPSAPDSTTVTIVCGADTETLTLTESGPTSAVFMGTITVISGSASSQNGTVEAAHDTGIQVTYIDADNGSGGTNIEVTANATADFVGPEISSVEVSEVSEAQAIVTFHTSEMATSTIYYGETLPPATVCTGSLGENHAVTVPSLEPCTFYYFTIEVTDAAGNTTIDDNGGLCYGFQTLDLILMLQENMDTDPGWTYQSQWAWGDPQGSNGDPSTGYTGNNVVGYNLNGSYTNNMPETFCTTGAIDCTGSSQVYFSYWKWLGVESATWDHASLRISNDGGSTWTSLWDHTGGSVSGGTWEYEEYDISSVAAGHSDVRIRWVMGTTDTSVVYCGWNIDDVEVSYTELCNEPTPTPYQTCIHDGDVNLDGSITAGDAQMAFMIALGAYSPTEEQRCAADCSGDDMVTAGDAQQIFLAALGTGSCADPL
ncbi:hypothetical protein JXA80_01230 [bacterium]|nr:hypothetical protein [candidate division CSSED10-310 bacterium]